MTTMGRMCDCSRIKPRAIASFYCAFVGQLGPCHDITSGCEMPWSHACVCIVHTHPWHAVRPTGSSSYSITSSYDQQRSHAYVSMVHTDHWRAVCPRGLDLNVVRACDSQFRPGGTVLALPQTDWHGLTEATLLYCRKVPSLEQCFCFCFDWPDKVFGELCSLGLWSLVHLFPSPSVCVWVSVGGALVGLLVGTWMSG